MEHSITLDDLFGDTTPPPNSCASGPREAAQPPSDLRNGQCQPYFDTFTCFLYLPLELRQLVWKHTLPGGRNVDWAPKAMEYRSMEDVFITFPMALQVNRESRQIAIKLWKRFLIFNHQQHPAFPTEYRPWRSFFDPIVDVPYIRFSDLSSRPNWQYLKDPECWPYPWILSDHVACLEIRDVDWIIGRPKLGEFKNLDQTVLNDFQNLKEIILIPFFKRFDKRTMPAEGSEAWINRDMERAVRDLNLWYQAKHKKDGRPVPEIIINKWRNVGPLTDEERYKLRVPYPWLEDAGVNSDGNEKAY